MVCARHLHGIREEHSYGEYRRSSCFGSTCSDIHQMYALRFFIGLLESCAFPGYIAILGSWYGPQELAKRTAVLLEVESIASMFSGYLQAGLHSSMNGHAGLAGWQWLFIMDGVISIPIALWGFFGLPDMPHNTRAFYWSAEVSQRGLSNKMGRRLIMSSIFATALNESKSSVRKLKISSHSRRSNVSSRAGGCGSSLRRIRELR